MALRTLLPSPAMLKPHSSTIVATALLLGFSLLVVYFRLQKRSLPALPPGPRKLPIIGNMLQIPKWSVWETYDRWSKDIGSDIIHLSVVGTNIVILNSEEAVSDLLLRRSPVYSSRPHTTMLGDLMGWDRSVIFMPYGEQWRIHRRIFYEEFNSSAVKRFEAQQVKATHDCLLEVLNNPGRFMDHVQRMTADVIVSIAYGFESEPYMATLDGSIDGVRAASTPGKFLVDSIPLLRYVPDWFPGASFKRQAKKWRRLLDDMCETPFAATKHLIDSGLARPSFVSSRLGMMDASANIAQQESMIRDIAGTMYAAGSETTSSAILSFILAMLSNPDAQSKAQAEIDSVLKQGVMPQFGDMDSLPYVSAIVKEVLRWRIPAPMGAPHFLSVDDNYRGYHIPAGSIVLSNLWAILHDEDVYPDSFSFKPERFIRDGSLNPDIMDPLDIVFGIGRRVCPGRHLAYSFLWITVTSMLAVFDITKAVDDDGRVIEPTHEYTKGFFVQPVPFKCSIKPRSMELQALIRSSVEDAD